jgi:predicted ATP-grasp superfamily ATP-dependent carboligase
VKRPVLVLGWVPRIVSIIARSLSSYGIPVDLAISTSDPRIRSRRIREFTHLPDPVADSEGFVRNLGAFIARHGHDMLIPADDLSLAAVVDHYDELKHLLHIACPPPDIARLVLNKAKTLEIGQKCGLAIPRTLIVSSSTELLDLLSNSASPFILKPAEKQQRGEELKACLLANADDVTKRFPTQRHFDPPMLLQEYCHGTGVGVEVLLRRGERLATFQHRRLQELPYGGGFAVTAVSEPLDFSLVEPSLALLRAMQWDGVAMVEYRINPEDGRAVLMEVNGRYWGSIGLAVMSGIDFPLYQWKLIHGEPPNVPSTYTVGTKWRWTVGYLARLHSLLLASRHSVAARDFLRKSLAELADDFDPSVHDAMFTPSDPVPAVFELLRAIKEFTLHDVKGLLNLFNRSSHQS